MDDKGGIVICGMGIGGKPAIDMGAGKGGKLFSPAIFGNVEGAGRPAGQQKHKL